MGEWYKEDTADPKVVALVISSFSLGFSIATLIAVIIRR